MPARPYVTLHAPMARHISQQIVGMLDEMSKRYQIRYWTVIEDCGDLVVMVDIPDEWHTRAPTAKEWEVIEQLLDEGKMEQYKDVLQRGLPPTMR